MKAQSNTIFICRMPEIAGYGIVAFGNTPEQAENECRKVFKSLSSILPNFKEAMACYGGTMTKVKVPSAALGEDDGVVVKSYAK